MIEENLLNPEFSVERLEKETGVSHTQLNRKLKALTDLTPTDFIRNYKIKKAARLLTANEGNVSEVAHKVGFTNLSYFSKCFKEVYGVTPSQYLKKEKRPLHST